MSRQRAAVCAGKGQARSFMELDWVERQFREKFGFQPYPGTLNLLAEGAAANAATACESVRIEPGVPGYCAADCWRVVVGRDVADSVDADSESGVPAVWIRPLVPDYPENQIELVADCRLRKALDLSDGDTVWIWVCEDEK